MTLKRTMLDSVSNLGSFRVLVAATHGSINGIERYGSVLVRGLLAMGHEVGVMVTPLAKEQLPEGPHSHLLQEGQVNRLVRFIGPWASISQAEQTRQISERYDVIHAIYPQYLTPWGDTAAVTTAWHSRPRVIDRARSANERSERRRTELLFAISDRIAYRRAQAVVAVSAPTAEALETLGFGHKTSYLPPFLDGDPEPCRALGSSRVVFAARWLDAKRKRLPLAIEAVSLLRSQGRKLQMDLIGEFRSNFQLPDFCRLLGLAKPSEVPSMMAGAAVAVVSSSYEEFGYVALDALHAGVPVAVSPIPALSGLPTDGIVTAQADTAEALAAAIASAADLQMFEFPRTCRARVGIEALTAVYTKALATSS